MKSAKEKLIETKILEKIKKYNDVYPLVKILFENEELHEMQDYANIVSIKRLGFNDHGPVHMKQVASNAIKMLEILHDSGIKTSLEIEEAGSFEDSMCAVILAAMMHDLGMMTGRQAHEEMSVTFALNIMDNSLKQVFKNDIRRQVVIKALATEAIIGHMAQRKIHSLEAGIILVADGCDMTKGRARIPLALHSSAPRVGDIHIYSANAISRVGIHHGVNKPVRVDIQMSSEVGFFQIEEVLLAKVNSSPAKQYIEVYAGVKGSEAKCYL
ncbi:MAG: hypothetical protein LUE64_02475 [Candidatus Gastranaerophilales bacterium]|nr:hypothetical protein [Candidatus Gastranaerophilales bacterium]